MTAQPHLHRGGTCAPALPVSAKRADPDPCAGDHRLCRVAQQRCLPHGGQFAEHPSAVVRTVDSRHRGDSDLVAQQDRRSLESIVGFAPMLGAWLISSDPTMGGSGIGLNPTLALVIVFVAGALIGAINGFLVVKMRLTPFIVTLSSLILLRGLTLGLTNGTTFSTCRIRSSTSAVPSGWTYRLRSDCRVPVPDLRDRAPLSPARSRPLRDRRQHRGRAGLSGSASTASSGVHTSWLVGAPALMLSGRIASVVSSQGQNMIFYVLCGGGDRWGQFERWPWRLLGALRRAVARVSCRTSHALAGADVLDRRCLRRDHRVALIFARLTGDRAWDA